MLSGAGETTCGNTRCPLHTERFAGEREDVRRPGLSTLELPFSYVEHGESKFALVKVVLCPKCVKKLMWKRTRDKERARAEEAPAEEDEEWKDYGDAEGDWEGGERSREEEKAPEDGRRGKLAEREDRSKKRGKGSRRHGDDDYAISSQRERQRVRSRSPRQRKHDREERSATRRRRSP